MAQRFCFALLFGFSLCVFAPAQAAPEDAALITALTKQFSALIAGGQYMKHNCADTTSADWPGVPLQRCKYDELGAKAEVTLALPDGERLARWTVTACRDAAAKNIQACATYLRKRIWSASNAQFPVSGYVIEPKSVLGGTSNAPYCFLFRNGVTVRTASVTSRPPENGICGPASAEAAPISKAFSFARIASTSREEFSMAPGGPSAASVAGIAFPEAVRKDFVAAWTSERNRLISGAAISGKKNGDFN
jgi:hypothetical protein